MEPTNEVSTVGECFILAKSSHDVRNKLIASLSRTVIFVSATFPYWKYDCDTLHGPCRRIVPLYPGLFTGSFSIKADTWVPLTRLRRLNLRDVVLRMDAMLRAQSRHRQ